MNEWKPAELLGARRQNDSAHAALRQRVSVLFPLTVLALGASWIAAIYAAVVVHLGGFIILSLPTLGITTACWFWASHLRKLRAFVESLENEAARQRFSGILLDNLLANFPGPIYFKDHECRFLRISQAHVRLFRLQREEEAWGKTDLDMFTSEHGQQAMRDEQEIMRTGTPIFDLEEKETWADGRETWASTSKMPLRDEMGRVIGTFGLSLDVTNRKQAEAAVKLERDLLHALMDNIPDLIYFKDSESRYARINRAHAQVLGLLNPEEAVGKSDFDFFPAQFAQAARDSEIELMNSGRSVEGRVEHESKTGRWYLATKVPLRNAAGKVTGLVGISKDITERRQAEEKLEQDLHSFLTVVSAAARGELLRRGEEGEDTLGRIARSINEMLQNFSSILAGVRDVAFSVSTSAAEILAAATQISKGAQHGSDQVHETSSAVEEMASSMAEVARSAELSADTAKQVLSHLHQGEESVNAAADSMTRIDLTTAETAEKMRLLEKRSKQIFDIIAMIEEIAGQSTLLSLNAAIAAAHAGDAGRGFGVVAEEIRHLAERSSESAKQVSSIVKGIVDDTRLVLQAMEKGAREVHGGRELSENAQDSLRAIQALVEKSVVLSEQILRASREQTQATQTVSNAMQTIADISQQSSVGASETTKAVRSLVMLSEQLNQGIAHFKISGTDE